MTGRRPRDRRTVAEVRPGDVAVEASTIASRAVMAAARRLDRSTVLAELRVQALAIRHAAAALELYKQTLVNIGRPPAAVDAAIDVDADPVMAELVRVADADLASSEPTGATVRLDLPSGPRAAPPRNRRTQR